MVSFEESLPKARSEQSSKLCLEVCFGAKYLHVAESVSSILWRCNPLFWVLRFCTLLPSLLMSYSSLLLFSSVSRQSTFVYFYGVCLPIQSRGTGGFASGSSWPLQVQLNQQKWAQWQVNTSESELTSWTDCSFLSLCRLREEAIGTSKVKANGFGGRSHAMSIIQQPTSDFSYQQLTAQINVMQGMIDKRLVSLSVSCHLVLTLTSLIPLIFFLLVLS